MAGERRLQRREISEGIFPFHSLRVGNEGGFLHHDPPQAASDTP